MTTVAYKDGIMAVDSGVWSNDVYTGPTDTKGQEWTRDNTHFVAAISGVLAAGKSFLRELKKTGEPNHELLRINDDDDMIAVVMVASRNLETNDIRVLIYRHWGFEDETGRAHTAIGSGFVSATTAMFLGHSAVEAVEAAIEMDAHTRGPIISFSV